MTCSSVWFSRGTLVSSTNNTDCHYITELLLKVSLNTITLFPHKLGLIFKLQIYCYQYSCHSYISLQYFVYLFQYFYSIKDISIGGQCICYGHAGNCRPIKNTDVSILFLRSLDVKCLYVIMSE